jgi:hypothetical protein
MKRLASLGIAATVWVGLTIPVAQADIGGNVPGPGVCDYPGMGGSGMDMGAYHYWCDFPTEENGSHWHCEYGGGAGRQTPLGVLEGSCSFRCPDGSLSAAPNPPGAWKNAITPNECVPLGGAPASEPNTGLPPSPGQLPGVTNPATANPVTTENP